MEATEIKTELHHKIDEADTHQVKEIYGLITNYLNGNTNAEEFDALPAALQQNILKGLEQAGTVPGNSLKSINQRLTILKSY